MAKVKLPQNLQAILWSRDIKKIDPEKDRNYIVHQILAYGGWNHLTWLVKNYNLRQIRKIFITKPAKDYSARSFNFVRKILLKIPESAIDERRYVKTFSRVVG